MKITTYYRKLAELLEKEKLITLNILTTFLFIWHPDNFDLDFARKRLSRDSKSLQNHHYTAIGGSFNRNAKPLNIKNFKCFLKVVLDLGNHFFELYAQTFSKLEPFDPSYGYWWASQSTSDGLDLYNNPIRPIPNHVNDFTCMSKYRTVSVFSHIINSTEGLFDVLFKLMNKYSSDNLMFIKVDVNIYLRIYKILHVLEGLEVLPEWNKKLVVIHGPWHTFKMCCIVVWRMYAENFLLRIVAKVYPKVNAYFKQSLPLQYLVDIINIITLAYRYVNIEVDQTTELGKNLHALLELYLPALRDFYCSLRTNNYPDYKKCKDVLLYILIAGKQTLYKNSELFQMLQMEVWKEKYPSLHQTFKQNLSMFSEEIGEVAFSLMASHQHLYTESNMLKHKRRHFKVLNKIHEVNNVFNETNTHKDNSLHNQGFHEGSTEVQNCILELKSIIEETNNRTLRRQNYETKKKRYVLIQGLVPINPETMKKCYLENNDEELTKALKTLRRGFLGKKTIDDTKAKVLKCLHKNNIFPTQK